MSGQRDHASNPRGRRKAGEGERVMHAERQRAGREQESVTPGEAARARLDALTRFPGKDDPDAARRLAAAMGVLAQCRHARFNAGMAGRAELPEPWTLLVMSLETVAMVLLMNLNQVDHSQAIRVARQVIDAWDADGAIGEMLADHLAALGIDTDEVNRLEEAWQALPEVQAAGQPAEAPPVNLGYMSLPAEVQRDLEAGQGDA